MEPQTFTPKLTKLSDNLSQRLTFGVKGILILMVLCLPFFFIPNTPALLQISKTFMVSALVLVSAIIASLAILRRGTITLYFPTLLLAWWGVVLLSFVSAILSPTLRQSLIGNSLETQTVGFLFILGCVMTLCLTFRDAKKSLMILLVGLMSTSVFLAIFHIIRLLSGSDILSLGVLPTNSSSLIGSWNDLGIFLAMAVVMVLISLMQLPLSKKMIVIAGLFLVPMLVMLTVINFFILWAILGFISLTILVYSLVRDRFTETTSTISTIAITIISAIVFTTAVINVLGGGAISNWVNAKTSIDYVEVRPSTNATLEIMRSVYQDNAFTGIGPNRFADAWRLYKNPAINQTIFWNTQFSSGSGYIPTWFVTTGIFGVLGWVIFIAIFLYTGFMMLMRSQSNDRFWFYIATVSYLCSAFLWLLALLYVPGPVILILASLMTGILLVANQALSRNSRLTINFLINPRTGFVLIAGVMVIIIGSVGLGYGLTRQFTALYSYVHAGDNLPADVNQIKLISSRIASAYEMFSSDVFARDIATYQLVYLNSLLAIPEPTTEDQQAFQLAIANSVTEVNKAISLNPLEARNYTLLGDLMLTLASVKIEGASDRAKEAYNQAKVLDPKNPYYDKQLAIMAYQTGEMENARTLANSALVLKPNYTDALFLLSQLDIAAGDIKTAITHTESIVAFEPNNPGRFYQLGVLYVANNDSVSAIKAFSRALDLNPSYANARYLRAIQYLATGNKDLAISELKLVSNLNPDNASLNEMITKIENGEIDGILKADVNQVAEPTITNDNDNVTTTELPETNLLTPVNTVPENQTKPKSEEKIETPTPTNPTE